MTLGIPEWWPGPRGGVREWGGQQDRCRDAGEWKSRRANRVREGD